MKTTLYKSEERGYASHGWLEARHTFSFASWFNPQQMNFGLLRVLNDDIIAPGAGFPTHPHENMEIVTIPLSGTLEHKDSMGNTAQVETDEVQVMSAGTGVTHSEYNASREEQLKLFQIWIFPKKQNIEPRYGQISIDRSVKNKWIPIITPDGEENTLTLNQDVYMSIIELELGVEVVYDKQMLGAGIFLMVITGDVEVCGSELSSRDALGIEGEEGIIISCRIPSRLLLIEVPMV